MTYKECTGCGQKLPLAAFYPHPYGKHGVAAKCKECVKEATRIRRLDNLEKYRAADRKRGCRNTTKGQRKMRREKPNQYKAQTMIGNAKRDGYLHEEPCYQCGSAERLHAHHDDYLKPYNIRWLCAACHKAWHDEHGEGANP